MGIPGLNWYHQEAGESRAHWLQRALDHRVTMSLLVAFRFGHILSSERHFMCFSILWNRGGTHGTVPVFLRRVTPNAPPCDQVHVAWVLVPGSRHSGLSQTLLKKCWFF